ncbi:MAG: hypothetical protein QME78_00195 [Thermodesulfobacteriota bacterium]|nr:hypothetical protein [Thermodesulfobacteriota bacterium]
MSDEIQKAIDRAKAMEMVRRVLADTRAKVAWVDHVLDYENLAVAAAYDNLNLAEKRMAADLEAHLQAHGLTVGPGNDREPVNVIAWSIFATAGA